MQRGSYIVNTARGAIMDPDAVVPTLESGQLAGYAGDVWYPQPPPPDHPWRTMPFNAMTPHTSGTSLRPRPDTRRGPGDPRILFRRPADPARVPHVHGGSSPARARLLQRQRNDQSGEYRARPCPLRRQGKPLTDIGDDR